MWTIELGKLPNDEWAADVTFAEVSDEQWAAVRSLAEKYAKFNFRGCPPISASESKRRLRFRIGHAMQQPQAVGELSSVECETLRDNLVASCEGLYKNGLGLWYLDRNLVWKIDGFFTFVPTFWLPALPEIAAKLSNIAPECATETLTNPSPQTDIYAIASVCFRALTGREYDADNPILPGDILSNLQPWDAVLDPALRKSPTRRPASFQEWRKNQPQKTAVIVAPNLVPATIPVPNANLIDPSSSATPNRPKTSSRRKLILAIVALVVLVVVGRNIAPNLMRYIPVLNLAAPSYQRGTGSYVVRYADRSYDGAKWKVVWTTENVEGNGRLEFVSGWDKNNLAVAHSSYMIRLKDGQWDVLRDKMRASVGKLYFTDKNTFFVAAGNYVRKYNHSTFFNISAGGSDTRCLFYQLAHDEYFYVTASGAGNVTGFLFEMKDKNLVLIAPDDKRFFSYGKNNKPSHSIMGNGNKGICAIHSYSDGRAIAYYNEYPDYGFLQYKDGLWHKHISYPWNSNYAISKIWAMDDKNFIAVGMDHIAQIRDGTISHPEVLVSGWSFNSDWREVWGVSIDKYWIMDCKGNIVQYEDGKFRGVVRGPELPHGKNYIFRDTWVSPEGVVYAITDKEVYRLD